MRAIIREAALLLVPLLSLTFAFSGLVANPRALIVDAVRPSLDHVGPRGSRLRGNDLTSVVLPRFEWLRRLGMDRGVVPYWDPSGFGGRPFVGNPQSGLFYPPLWLALWWGEPHALGWLTFAHHGWAGLGMYLLGRAIGLSRLASAVSSTCYGLSPYLMAHTFEGHYPHVWAACWYPWVLWLVLKARGGSLWAVFLLPITLTLTFLTGHPQEWYLLSLALGIWVLHDLILNRGYRTPTTLIAFSTITSLLIISIELIPQFQLRPWLATAQESIANPGSHYIVRPANLLQLITPNALGEPHNFFGRDNYWETVLSFGLIPLLLGVVAIRARFDGRTRCSLVAMVATCIIFACGRPLGLYSIAYRFVPGMSSFRVPARSLFLASLGMSLLAGLGLDAITDQPRVRLIFRRTLLGLATTLVLSGMLALLVTPSLGEHPAPTTVDPSELASWAASARKSVFLVGLRTASTNPVVWGAILVPGLVLHGQNRNLLRPSYMRWAIALVAAAELAIHGQRLMIVSSADHFLPRSERFDRLFSSVQTASGPWRIASLPDQLTDLSAARAGVEKLNVNDIFKIQHTQRVYRNVFPFLDPLSFAQASRQGPMDHEAERFHREVAARALCMMSVRYLLTPHEIGLQTSDTSRPDSPVLENPEALPRAFVVPYAQTQNGSRAVPDWLSAADPRKQVTLVEDPLPRDGPRQAYRTVTWLAQTSRGLDLSVTTDAPGFLVIGNTWMPGWNACVNGDVSPVLLGNGWQQVLPLRTAGLQRVRLRYEPPGYRLGWLVSVSTLSMWITTGLTLALLGRSRRQALLTRIKPSPVVSG